MVAGRVAGRQLSMVVEKPLENLTSALFPAFLGEPIPLGIRKGNADIDCPFLVLEGERPREAAVAAVVQGDGRSRSWFR